MTVTAATPSSSSQLRDVERVAGGQRVGGGRLRLEAVDVAAVAEQVAIQRVAAVSLLVVQLEAAVLTDGHTGGGGRTHTVKHRNTRLMLT